METQVIVSPSGERLVVIPESEYQALIKAVEDSSDRRATRRFRQELAEGEEELLPDAFVGRILEEENRVRAWREYRGLSISSLAESSGLGLADISRVESGSDLINARDLKAIADALGIEMDDLI